MALREYKSWEGGLDDLIEAVGVILTTLTQDDIEPINVRLVRDYISRGILGEVRKSGRELVFAYEQLARLIVARILRSNGWSLSKIKEFFDLSRLAEIESVLPRKRNAALDALENLRAEAGEPKSSTTTSHSVPLRKTAQVSSIDLELRAAMRRLGLSEDAPPTEDLTLIAIAPWFQVLLEADRLPRLSLDDAEELGRAVTASLVRLITKKGV
jgi:DNA-binding transcriptional MerR regulator